MEVDFMKRKGVIECTPVQECLERTDKAPISARCVGLDLGKSDLPGA